LIEPSADKLLQLVAVAIIPTAIMTIHLSAVFITSPIVWLVHVPVSVLGGTSVEPSELAFFILISKSDPAGFPPISFSRCGLRFILLCLCSD